MERPGRPASEVSRARQLTVGMRRPDEEDGSRCTISDETSIERQHGEGHEDDRRALAMNSQTHLVETVLGH